MLCEHRLAAILFTPMDQGELWAVGVWGLPCRLGDAERGTFPRWAPVLSPTGPSPGGLAVQAKMPLIIIWCGKGAAIMVNWPLLFPCWWGA